MTLKTFPISYNLHQCITFGGGDFNVRNDSPSLCILWLLPGGSWLGLAGTLFAPEETPQANFYHFEIVLQNLGTGCCKFNQSYKINYCGLSFSVLAASCHLLNPVKIKDTTNLTQLSHLSFIVLSHGLLFFNLLSKACNKISIISPDTLMRLSYVMDKIRDNILES